MHAAKLPCLPPERVVERRPPEIRGPAALPSLFRFLFVIAVLAGIVWGGMIALVTFVEPQPREMTQAVPPSKLTGK